MTDPTIVKFLAALEETQYLAPDRMAAYQRRLLDRLLRHARAETAFYADRLAPIFRARRQHRLGPLDGDSDPHAGRGAGEYGRA